MTKRYQISIRSILAFMALATVPLTYYVSVRRGLETERHIYATPHEGSLYWAGDHPCGVRLAPIGTEFERRVLGEDLFQRAVFLDLQGIFNPRLTADTIPRMQYVRDIRAGATTFNDRNVDKLARLPRLETLFLSGNSITNDSLPAIGSIKTLTHLNLGFSGVHAPDLSPLTRLPNLRSLNLENCGVTDEQFKQLALMRSLEFLSLKESQITYPVALEIASLENLRRLSISGENLSTAMIRELYEANPHLKLQY